MLILLFPVWTRIVKTLTPTPPQHNLNLNFSWVLYENDFANHLKEPEIKKKTKFAENKTM